MKLLASIKNLGTSLIKLSKADKLKDWYLQQLKTNKKSCYIYSGATIVVIIALVVLLWPTAEVVKPKLEPVKKVEKVLPKHKLTVIKVNSKDNITTLTLELSKDIMSKLTTTGNTINLLLADTGLANKEQKLPHSGLITSITAQQLKQDLLLSINTTTGTIVKSLHMSNKKPFYLTLTLENPAKAKPIEKEKPKPVIKLTRLQTLNQDYQQIIANSSTPMEVAASLQKLLTANPDYLPARTGIIKTYIQEKKYDLALALIKQGLSIKSNSIELKYLEAYTLNLQGYPDKALQLLMSQSPTLANNEDYYTLLAALLIKTGDYEKASKIYSSLIEVNQTDGRLWLGIGIAFEHLHKPNAAVEAYKRSINSGDLTPLIKIQVQDKIRQLGG